METKTYKIVFSGDLAFDTDADEVSAALAEKCHYPQPVIDKILGSKKITIKKGLSAEDARRYKNFFDHLGLMCDMISEQERQQVPELLKEAPVKEKKAAGRCCPKCGSPGQTGDTCLACGIIFKRFEQVRNRGYEDTAPFEQIAEPTILIEPLWQRLLKHPIIQVLLILLVILLFRGPLHTFYFLAIAMAGAGVIAYFLFQANETGDSALDLCSAYIALWPQKLDKGEKIAQDRCWSTAILTYLQMVIFYLVILFFPQSLPQLSFLPTTDSVPHLITSFLVAPLIHANSYHLWLNITFLWLLSCHIEKHLGRKKCLYLGAAALIPQAIYALAGLALGQVPHVIGSSALIACALGTFVALKPHDFVESSFPVVAPLLTRVRISIKVEINPIVMTGLFFLLAFGGTVLRSAPGSSQDLMYPVTGLICGLCFGSLSRLHNRS